MADLVPVVKEKGLQRVSKFFEFLGFYLERELFGVPLKEVVEISKLLPIVPVPFSSPLILGVINIRGEILPVIDLKTILRLRREREGDRVVLVESHKGKVGILVDEVVGVIRIEEEKLEPNPMSGRYSEYIRNVAQLPQGLISIIEFDRVVDSI
ncbi:chemotaxis protein CheW [Hydrogenobacter sp. T-2]|uniref:chemotaxis protein CheW n=1 Tax=Pampinifervens diazotrophicum TaxID=1632018 RepID=UPI002B258118|nr:chemotaxis protein CheW [Hydrogenobacter sp. T-2]WPM31631.1 chemotaxis protein CheW [Hydrogenobacter sp. T-2]